MAKVKKIALVTGATRGIGEATAKRLAAANYLVCINYRSYPDQAEKLAEEIYQTGGQAETICADISDETAVRAMFEKMDTLNGRLAALVNNAAINGGVCEAENLASTVLDQVFRTNVYGVWFCAREAVKRMKHTGGGGIVNVSSEAAKFGGTHLAHYAASKAAVNTFTLAFAREVAPHGIRVNAVSPGVIDTPIHDSSDDERMQKLKNSLPMGRMGLASEVADVIAWLLSSEAGYMSGAVVPVTGGR